MWTPQWFIGRARSRFGYALVLITLVFFLYLWFPRVWLLRAPYEPLDLDDSGRIALPVDYREILLGSYEEPGLCTDRYGTEYIRKFSASATDHCQNFSVSTLTCFTHKAHDDRTDSFCVGVPAAFDPRARAVEMDCPIRDWTDADNSRNAHRLNQFPTYWYGTGPRVVFDQFIHLDSHSDETKVILGRAAERTILLVKREDTVSNLWHTLMQVMSLWLSLDILSITLDPRTGRPFFSKHDERTSQVAILDHFEDGPFWELWDMFGGLPTARMEDISYAGASTALIPLPGGSNPFWEGDWVDLDCGQSSLLQAFSRRVVNHYGLSLETPKRNRLTLTLIDRRGSRKLIDQDQHFAALQAKFPEVDCQLVDFAQLSFKEQLQTVRQTHILAGVHGAGLTHGFFMLPNTTVVEIQPPSLDHRGFHNMAKWLGLQYFREHGHDQSYEGKTHDWHGDHAFITEEKFLNLMEEAIRNTTP